MWGWEDPTQKTETGEMLRRFLFLYDCCRSETFDLLQTWDCLAVDDIIQIRGHQRGAWGVSGSPRGQLQ